MNRIVGNVIIVDSAMGNAFVLTSANLPVQIRNMKVNAIAFWSTSTTGACTFTESDTSGGPVALFARINATDPATIWTSFGDLQYFHDLKVPLLTNGTAWIYLA